MSTVNPRGSEWRQWDLHVHTPGSYQWSDGKTLSEMTDVEKKAAIQKFIQTVNASDVEVFAVQDYWNFDWILELRKYTRSHPEELTKTVLPGMELRVECATSFRLNIHAIVSPKVTDQQLKDFRSALQIRTVGDETQNLSDEALTEFARGLDASKAEVHGFADPSTLSDEDLLKLGSMTAQVTRDSLSKAIKKLPRKDMAYILLPYSTSDGLLKLDWREQPADDVYFMQTAHVFETRDQRNIDLFGGVKTDENEEIFDNFFKTLGGKPKPGIAGSDAHKFANYGKFPSNKATWIKADPTFQGFEQIIYEPTSRVKVQQLRPEEKSPQLIIDRVEFTNPDGAVQVVRLNQNLNSLIGSRAQGKSNLLKNIAYAVDPEQTKIRNIDTSDFIQLQDFKVYWNDGSENTLDPDEDKDKGILFIPQKFMGDLLYGKDPQFDSFLTNLFENKEDFKVGLSNYRSASDQNLVNITAQLREVMATRDAGNAVVAKLRKLGKRDGYIKETGELDARIKILGQEAKISETDLKKFDELNENHEKVTHDIEVAQKDIDSLENLKSYDVITAENIEEYAFTKDTFNRLIKQLEKEDANFKNEFVKQEVETLKEKVTKNQKALLALNKELIPLQQKFKKHAALVELTEKQAKLKAIIQDIEKSTLAYGEIRKLYVSKFADLVSLYKRFDDEYKNLDVTLPELQFSNIDLKITFKKESLLEWVDQYVNFHNSVEFKKDVLNRYRDAIKFLDNPEEWEYEQEAFQKLLHQLTTALLNGQLVTKSGYSKETVIEELFRNRFSIDFLKSVTNKDGVTFDDMSDGEQMLSLLEMIFKFDDYNYPVLLDQPEDDLDSRAISTTVVDFLSLEKQTRQIVAATHNANIVVCGDSENVLVSKKIPGNPPKFSYEVGAIEDPRINSEILEILEGGVDAFEKRRKKIGKK
jgi:energy-coupling factor transporter ATP-binding protein EcfA2